MDYEKAYKEALKRARELSKTTTGANYEYIFPELNESDDEKIRGAIIHFISHTPTVPKGIIGKETMISWLEKQGKQKVICAKCVKDHPYDSCQSVSAFGNCPFENEQNSTIKDKPKFEVGAWITFFGGKPFKILKVESGLNGILGYLLLDQTGSNLYYNKKYVDENARLWTIQDAQPGDILVCPKYASDTIPNIFIFKFIETKDNDVYCYCSFLKVFAIGGYVASADPIDTDFCPATKEQCDILFQKMNDAAWEWDAKKKELKLHYKFIVTKDSRKGLEMTT